MSVSKSSFKNQSSPILFMESVYFQNGRPAGMNFSAMGFLYKRNLDGSFIFATCAHLFWPELFPVVENSFLKITKDYGTNTGSDDFLPFTILEGPKFSSNPNEDIALFKVAMSAMPKEEFILYEPVLMPFSKETVFLAQSNEDGEQILISTTGYQLLPFQRIDMRKRPSAMINPDNSRLPELLKQGACVYPCYNIHSEMGASGSPVWTSDNRLLGMNIGGMAGVWTALVPPARIDVLIKGLKW